MKLKDENLFRQLCYVDGEWKAADSKATIDVANPATDEVLGTVPKFLGSETRAAIAAAKRAQPAWAAMTAGERATILRRWNDLMLAHADDLALIMTLEQGKPLAESKGEVAYSASFIEWFAEEGKRIYGDVIPSHAADKRIVVLKQPVGVVCAITPWNFPSAMIGRKAGPALAAGCTFVCKPATQTPYSALALAELAHRAGIPKGVFNVLTGSAREIGAEMTSNPDVAKLTFTGSTEIGRQLLAQCAPTIKKVSMELGGNAPFIVFDDADLDAAVQGAIASKYRNTGQTCVCANRLYVQAGVYDAFVEKLKAAVGKLKVGNGTEPGVTQGPLIDKAAVAKMEEHIADAVAKGGKVVMGGHPHKLGHTFFEPTIITGATQDMLVAREETFGPLAPVIKFDTDADAIRMANDTPYGLSGSIWTENGARALRVARALETGVLSVNTNSSVRVTTPFGGFKQSGFGRELGMHGLDGYSEVKNVYYSTEG